MCAMNIVVLLLALTACAVDGEQKTPPVCEMEGEQSLPHVSKVDAFLKEFSSKRDTLGDYRAEFKQIKKNALFDDIHLSRGKVYYLKPRRILWDYLTPDPMKLLVQAQKVYMYIEELEQLEIYDYSEQKEARGLFLGFDESTEELRKLYDISLFEPEEGEDVRGVILAPKTDDLRQYFTDVRLWLRGKDFAIEKIVIEGPEEGDATTMYLERIETNSGLKPKRFELDLPEGTEIIVHHPEEELEIIGDEPEPEPEFPEPEDSRDEQEEGPTEPDDARDEPGGDES